MNTARTVYKSNQLQEVGSSPIMVMGAAGSSLTIGKTIVKNIGNPFRRRGWTYTAANRCGMPLTHAHPRLWAMRPLYSTSFCATTRYSAR